MLQSSYLVRVGHLFVHDKLDLDGRLTVLVNLALCIFYTTILWVLASTSFGSLLFVMHWNARSHWWLVSLGNSNTRLRGVVRWADDFYFTWKDLRALLFLTCNLFGWCGVDILCQLLWIGLIFCPWLLEILLLHLLVVKFKVFSLEHSIVNRIVTNTQSFSFFFIFSLPCLVLQYGDFQILFKNRDLVQNLLLHLIIFQLKFLPSLVIFARWCCIWLTVRAAILFILLHNHCLSTRGLASADPTCSSFFEEL